MKVLQQVTDICKIVTEQGHITYFSGFTTRNIILKIPSKIYYILTTADLITLSQLFEHIDFPGKPDYNAELKLEDIIIRFKIVNLSPQKIDFSILRKESLKELFTVDTLYYDPQREIFLDPLECYYDFRKKKLIPVPDFEDSYKNSPHKILHGFFLLAHINFTLPEELAEKIEKIPFTIKDDYREELRQGLTEVLTSKNPFIALSYMDRFHIIEEIFSEPTPARSVPQNKDFHPEGNVYEHTIECFKYIKKPPISLALALLLHDTGKPSTATIKGKILSFRGHSGVGVKIARKALRRLGYENKIIENVAFLIRYHLLTHEFRNLTEEEKLKFMQEPMFHNLLKLYKADVLSCYGELSDYKKIISSYKKVVKHLE